MSLRGASRGNPGESEFGDCETAADYFINLDSHGGLSPPRNDNGVLCALIPEYGFPSGRGDGLIQRECPAVERMTTFAWRLGWCCHVATVCTLRLLRLIITCTIPTPIDGYRIRDTLGRGAYDPEQRGPETGKALDVGRAEARTAVRATVSAGDVVVKHPRSRQICSRTTRWCPCCRFTPTITPRC